MTEYYIYTPRLPRSAIVGCHGPAVLVGEAHPDDLGLGFKTRKDAKAWLVYGYETVIPRDQAEALLIANRL